MSTPQNRSTCPINRAVELLGDRWTLLVLRDIVFRGHGHFRALLDGSSEKISSSVLSDRLNALVDHGILRRESCPTHRQKAFFQLTEAGMALVPVMEQLKLWALEHCDCDEDCAEDLTDGCGAKPKGNGETTVVVKI